jgi:hypothetical protein
MPARELQNGVGSVERPRGHAQAILERLDPNQRRPLDCRQRWRMAKPGLNSKVVRTSLFVLSIALIAWIVFTVW